jgi:Htaa
MAADTEAAAFVWGVKQSFRNYVEAAGGTIETGAGAARTPDGAFSFEAAPGETLTFGADGKPEGTSRFTGEVRFEAHGGMLKVFFADPAVEIGPDGASITVADSPARDRRVELALLDLDAATTDGGEVVIPSKLSKDGWRILGDHYGPMTPLDPVRLSRG